MSTVERVLAVGLANRPLVPNWDGITAIAAKRKMKDAKQALVSLAKVAELEWAEADDRRRRAEAARQVVVDKLVRACGGSVTETARLLETNAQWVYTVLGLYCP